MRPLVIAWGAPDLWLEFYDEFSVELQYFCVPRMVKITALDGTGQAVVARRRRPQTASSACTSAQTTRRSDAEMHSSSLRPC
jgi:hypothetical protein